MIDLPTEADPVKVICGDCLDAQREVPAGVFDRVVVRLEDAHDETA